MWPQHPHFGGTGIGLPTATTSKSPVLVILPPTHKCPDLERVLKLARKAFDDLSLNILDLNLRFAWVAADELQKDDPIQDGPSAVEWANKQPAAQTATQDARRVLSTPMSAVPAAPAPHVSPPPATIANGLFSNAAATTTTKLPASSIPAPPQPTPPPAGASGKVRIKEAEICCFRVFVSDLAPTLTDADILGMCPEEINIIGATFYPPRPIGPKKSQVRSATLAFAKAKHAKEYIDWIKQAALSGALAGKILVKVASAFFLAQGMTPEELMNDQKKAAFYGGDAPLPFTLDPASLVNVPRNAIVPDDLPEADDSYWRFIVGNLIGSLTKTQILANIVPHGIVLAGATAREPKELGTGRPELVRDIKLAFKSEVDANACHAWIKKQAEAGGVVARIVVPTGKISLNIPGRPLIPEAATTAPAVVSTSPANSHPSSPIRFTSSQLLLENLREVDPAAAHRLTVGNLNGNLTQEQLLAGLIPPGISPVGMSLLPQQQLTGRPEMCSFVLFEFNSERDVQATHDWIRAEAVVGGRVAKLMPPNVKIVACVHTHAPVANAPSTSPSKPKPFAHGPAAPLSGSSALHFPNLREVSPLAPYRLVIGNLLDSLTKAQLLANLVPPGFSPVGMTVRPPLQISGRAEMCSLVTFEYKSEHDLETAHGWVRAQAAPGGRVSGLFVPGVKIVCNMRKPGTGNPPADAPFEINTLAPRALFPSLPQAPVVSAEAMSSATTLPEASPDHYRLHVSNLKPDLELAQIIPMLIPRDIKLVGASLFAPRPMGGSRRELVRSLKFAFLTESDAKRCQEWIKKDLGGGVTKVVLPGAKIVVGNPMDPMVSDPLPLPRDSVLGGNPYALLAEPEQVDEHGPPRSPPVETHRSPSPASVASTTTVASTAGESMSQLAQSKQFRISVNGIDPSKPVSAVFGAILGSLSGAAAEPARMGIRNADGRRGAEFVFDSEADAKQFVLHVWIAIQDGVFSDITADGEELRIGRGSG